jgi:hypothetical protein
MKTIALVMIAALAGCVSEKVNRSETLNQLYYTQTSDATHLAVLVGRSAKIEGRELIWSCIYRTVEGQVTFEQREECAPTR